MADTKTAGTNAEPTGDQATQTWPELAIGLYDKLTGRGAQITYEFDDFQVDVPTQAGGSTEHARWRMNGTVRIRTSDEASR